ncbi:hypothetical protein KX729_30380 [Rhizobium sp. XQZ8]|uniref:hypothetical protein n=1 Tax=Rhizobium populisoli TaxID=2859785 RepID=UPI001CA47409|nr:hypothetical protein [Rhizobium populisoli]MBW6425701.1 hypothetical protein [Rhizobium populisoli]
MNGVALHSVGMNGFELADKIGCLLHHPLGATGILTREFIRVQADRFSQILGEDCSFFNFSRSSPLTRRYREGGQRL